MTAPVRTIAAKFTAEGSEVVQAALAKVTAAAQAASAKIAQASQAQAAGWQQSVQAAERAAYAEQSLRERNTQQAVQAANRVAMAQTRAVTQTAAHVQGRMGMMALSVASSFNQMAAAGDVTAGGLKNVVAQTALVATQVFGKGGPWGAAISVGLLALTQMFGRAREEQQQFAKDWNKSLTDMINAGDSAGLMSAVRTVWMGTAAGEYRDGLGPRMAQLGISGGMEGLQDALAAAQISAKVRGEGAKARAKEIEELIALQKRYNDLTAAILNSANAVRPPGTTAPITINPPGDRQYPRLTGAPLPTRGRFDSAALDANVDSALGLVGGRPAIRPLGDPKKFAEQLTADVAESFKHFKLPPFPEQVEWRESFATAISMTLIDGFSSGIERAFASGSIGDGFAALSGALLSGLGTAMIDFGKAALVASTLMAKIRHALATLNPFAGAAAAVALIAAGSALRGVAARAFGGMGGGGGGGGSGSYAGAAAAASSDAVTRLVYGNNSITTAVGMVPRTATQIVVIGPDDPRAQRAIVDILRKAEGRGMG